ncbi:MAG TPA: hypothetical protein VHE81_20930 [Lacipirellulaceae bacterium]|nr:hypothetical protein [Lacipirellulaceae bacterium]
MSASGAAALIACAAKEVRAADVGGTSAEESIRFPRSFLYCSPTKSGIWVRVQAECRGRLTNVATGRTDEYVLGVVAKTGLTPDPRTGGLAPGYDYWIIFSKTHVFTRRSHSSAYLNNPTVLKHEEFGRANWRLQTTPADALRSARDVRTALENWREVTAKTTFVSDDKARTFSVEYPVKWADFKMKSDGFRVETGPVFLLDPNKLHVGQVPEFEAFQWAYFDYHDFDKVRCLLDCPTSVLADVTFTPPKEDGREARKNKALTGSELNELRNAIFGGKLTTLTQNTVESLLSTDHYSQVKEVAATTKLFALRD